MYVTLLNKTKKIKVFQLQKRNSDINSRDKQKLFQNIKNCQKVPVCLCFGNFTEI